MTDFSENNLYGISEKLSKKDGIKGHFDLFIFTSSWESRCMEIINYDGVDFDFESAAIISFKLGMEKGYLPEYMDKLKSFVNTKGINSDIFFIEHESTELKKITNDIKNIIEKLVKDKNRPLHIGFDITSCPRFFFLYLLGFCLNNRMACKLSFFYSEGIYNIDEKDYVHTTGDWEIIEISGLEAKIYDPADKKMFVVSAGFEGNRFRSLVAKYEPDNLGILLPDPGFNRNYTQKVNNECKPMIDEYNISDDSIVKAPAGDAIAAWKALKTPSLNKDGYHIAYLTFGPKPHALAMGIHGFLNEKISVIYRIPKGYTGLEVKPTEIFWRYEIKNLVCI